MIVKDRTDRERAVRMVQGIRAEHCPAEVIVRPYDPNRSTPQNARHWALMSAIAGFMPAHMDGVWHSPEVWHAYFASRFLGVEEVTIGAHTFTRYQSTRKLGVAEFKALDDQIEAEMAVEYGFTWDGNE